MLLASRWIIRRNFLDAGFQIGIGATQRALKARVAFQKGPDAFEVIGVAAGGHKERLERSHGVQANAAFVNAVSVILIWLFLHKLLERRRRKHLLGPAVQLKAHLDRAVHLLHAALVVDAQLDDVAVVNLDGLAFLVGPAEPVVVGKGAG